jgi:quercetin dioxygenase-like cupin family protein
MRPEGFVMQFSSEKDGVITRRTVVEGLAGFLLMAGVSAAQTTPGGNKVVFQSDLPDVALKGWAVTAVEVAYAPGASSAPHRHPGITVAYVLEGEVRSKIGDGPEQSYKAGQMFLETPGQLHAVSRNGSTTQPARLLAILMAEKGQALTTPAK